MNKLVLPNWKLIVDKNLNKLIYVNHLDAIVEIDGELTENNLKRLVNLVFKKENQNRENWSKFLYDTALLIIEKDKISFHNYSRDAYKSWVIRNLNKEIEYDGRDAYLSFIVENKIEESIGGENVSYKDLVNFCNKL